MSTNVGDPSMRKSQRLGRLQKLLQKKQESLADQFNFKMLVTFHFKGKKSNAVFQVDNVHPVMTNNYEDCIMQGVKDEAYSEESMRELLEKDTVQFHAPKWQSLRRDLYGSTTNVDYFIWPRNDVEKIECSLFSKWKEDIGPYRKIEVNFEFLYSDIDKQAVYLASSKNDTGLIIANPEQNVFLFTDRLKLQSHTREVTILKLCCLCVYLPQDQLTAWGLQTLDQTRSALQAV
ncbi:uncharacterized protein C6orf62 homolog [Dreissena polymorpha]|uniref:Uncharacterized protein n=1 Tax=Dreissena polymorpha TaxID=45954 RepID=A0A9D3Y5Z5_DREPO|nr:uncharacterized protein C6orf62 homolog [Dreissena polymorpha]KAH3694010.1 hypothetical protein DPMN_081449 [Dreissena polymorpha]